MMPTRLVSALFVSSRSIYKHLDGVDAFDRSRDARANFAGLTPVIAHPPCRLWSKFLRKQASAKMTDHEIEREKELGLWAVKTVMSCGGVLEQPEGSLLWKDAKLPAIEDTSDPFCYTIYVEQGWFGFPTPKPTWLLICGVPRANLPALPYRPMPKSLVNFNKLNSFQRSRTMKPFANWLCQTARLTWWREEERAKSPALPPCQDSRHPIKVAHIQSKNVVFTVFDRKQTL